MRLDEIRIYSEVLEQGLDFKAYILGTGAAAPVKNIYAKKLNGEFSAADSIIDRIRRVKNVDVFITVVSGDCEYPLLLVEYSSAVPTDDHKMQRSDVYYWSAVFKTPMMKISTVSKGMDQAFGGGAKFTAELEIAAACRRNAVLYQIPWETEDGTNVLKVKENALSCVPWSERIAAILRGLVDDFAAATSFAGYFETVLARYLEQNRAVAAAYPEERIRGTIAPSTRFRWIQGKLCVKINRFGHGMDPDRGVLYFASMLLGAGNTIAEIQINRPGSFDCRGGYRKLFDALSRESLLEAYVRDIVARGNVMTETDAIYIFKTALHIDDALPFQKETARRYSIADEDLLHFLNTFPGMAAKAIFFLATELHLTDQKRRSICTIHWNTAPIERFLARAFETRPGVTKIGPLSEAAATEDIVTYASVELYKKLGWRLLAVSYPGAQGDRCVLTGSGREVVRTYVDIIACRQTPEGTEIYLEECKDIFAKALADERKLQAFKTSAEMKGGLMQFLRKTAGITRVSKLYTALAAKGVGRMPAFDVDYCFAFRVENAGAHTKIHYAVTAGDPALKEKLCTLEDREGRLSGTIVMDPIYRIVQAGNV